VKITKDRLIVNRIKSSDLSAVNSQVEGLAPGGALLAEFLASLRLAQKTNLVILEMKSLS
jgi:hypothetical protein